MSAQVHNSKTAAKLELRRRLLQRIDKPKVLECYSGPGTMRAHVYQGAEITGIDVDLRSVADYIGDCTKILRAIDLSAFNVFDADAFGSPWEAIWIIAQRRPVGPGETIIVVGTDGSAGGASNMNPTLARKGWSRQQAEALGLRLDDSPTGLVTGERAHRVAHDLLQAFFPTCEVRQFLTATGGRWGGTLYFGALLTGATVEPRAAQGSGGDHEA